MATQFSFIDASRVGVAMRRTSSLGTVQIRTSLRTSLRSLRALSNRANLGM
jgi:hypothetical protein